MQTVLLRTEPAGAPIFVQGERVGKTPALVEVARSRAPVVEFQTDKGLQSVELETSYRWGKSFWRGMLFFGYAPLAWTIDLLTGTAWQIEDGAPIPVKLRPSDVFEAKTGQPPVIVIAPPRSSSVAMSDAGGRALEKILRERTKSNPELGRVRGYDETLSEFIFQDYEHRDTDPDARRRILRVVSADIVYESFVEPKESGWELISEATNVYSSEQMVGPKLQLNRDSAGPRALGIGLGLRPWWSRILPDTAGIDFVNERIQLSLLNSTYSLVPVYGDEWWAQGLRYISAINISSTPDRRREFTSRWEFGAVPSFRFSRKYVKAQGLPPVSGQLTESEPEFTRWSASGGYGLEVGYLFGRHYVFFDLVPVFLWSEISWRQNGKTESATRTTLNAQVEIGYSYTFDSNLLFRFFSRTQAENVELWRDAYVARLGALYAPIAATSIVSGFSLGYRFDADRFQSK